MKNKPVKKTKDTELQSLNHELYSDFSIQELEERLETKPWICGVHGEDCGVDDIVIEQE